jgi:hypothetical protein
MTRFTLTAGDREYQLARLGTLRELMQRKLISGRDLVTLPGVDGTLTVDEVLAREVDYASFLDDAGSVSTADELWDALRDTGAYPVDDLVSQMMSGYETPGGRDASTRDDTPRPLPDFDAADPAGGPGYEGDLGQRIDEVVSREEEIEELPADAIASMAPIDPIDPIEATVPIAPIAPGDPPEAPREGALASGEWGASASSSDSRPPRSFAQFVQERQATPGLDIADERVRFVGGRTGRPIWLWPALIGLVGGLLATGTCGVVKQGAEQAFPLESEVRGARAAGGGGDVVPVPDDDPPEPRTPAPLAVEGNPRELLLRSQVPVPLQPFRSVEGFKDVLFMDLANSGVPAREIRIQALVVAPLPDPERQRPEEINLELRLAPLEGQAAEDAVLRACLVIGHYGADAHIRIRRVVIHNRAEDSPGTIYDVQGATVVAFFEGDIDVAAFLLASEIRTGSQYTLAASAEEED